MTSRNGLGVCEPTDASPLQLNPVRVQVPVLTAQPGRHWAGTADRGVEALTVSAQTYRDDVLPGSMASAMCRERERERERDGARERNGSVYEYQVRPALLDNVETRRTTVQPSSSRHLVRLRVLVQRRTEEGHLDRLRVSLS